MRILGIAVLCVIILVSCQKEARLDGGTTTTSGTKLVRAGTRYGSDTITLDYGYNGSNALTSLHTYGIAGGQAVDVQFNIKRNSSNIITSYVYSANYFAQLGIDSIQAAITYYAATSRYKTLVDKYTENGTVKHDSTVFNYDGSGKLTHYISYYNDGTGYLTDYKDTFAYAGNNLAFEKEYSFALGYFSLEQTTTYDQYDTKVNPSYMPSDAVILGMADFYSTNNVLKKTVIDHITNTTSTGTFIYTYDANGRPVKAIGTDGSSTSTTTYYYQ